MAKFRLSSSDKDFNSRVHGLLSCLDEVATDLPDDGLVFDNSASGKRKNPPGFDTMVEPTDGQSKSTGFRSSQVLDVSSGSFKTPSTDENTGCFITPTQRNIPSKRFKGNAKATPGYLSCPEKWTKYDMEDTEVMNDAQNKRAALQLLADLREKKKSLTPEEVDNDDASKIVFKKPSHKQSQDSVMDVSSYENVVTDMSGDFGGTKKIMMDEYVVGTKKTKAKKTNRPKNPLGSKKGDEVKLSYLSFDDDCE